MIRNERGGLIIAFAIGLATLMMALAMGGYLQGYLIPLRYAKSKAEFAAETTVLSSFVLSCLPRKTSPCAPAGSWQALVDTENLAPPSALISKAQIDSVLSSIDPGITSLSQLSDYSIILSRDSTDSDLGMGVIVVNAQIRASPVNPTLAPYEESRSYRIQVLSPAHFSLYLRPAAGAQITLNGGSQLSVYGESFIEVSGASLDISKISNPSGDLFFQSVRSNAQALSASTAAQLEPLAQQLISVRLNELTNIINPFSGATSSFWNDPLDYFYLYESTNKFPLPIVAGAIRYGHGPQMPDAYANAARAADTLYPSANNLATHDLEYTCDRAEDYMGFMRPLVIARSSANLTFNFTTGEAKYMCGLISGDTVTLVTMPGETHIIYGHINANRLVVNGGGEVIILSQQAMNQAIASVPLPPSFSPEEISRQMLTLSATTANNFYVPFYRNSAGLQTVMASRFKEIKDYFEDCGSDSSGNNYRCWLPYKDPIDYQQVQIESKALEPSFKYIDFALDVSETL
jgi:hypothetical protein